MWHPQGRHRGKKGQDSICSPSWTLSEPGLWHSTPKAALGVQWVLSWPLETTGCPIPGTHACHGK